MFYSPLLGKASNFAVFKWQSPVKFISIVLIYQPKSAFGKAYDIRKYLLENFCNNNSKKRD